MKTKQTRKYIVQDAFIFLVNFVVFLALCLAMLAIKEKNNTITFIKDNYENAIAVAGGVALLLLIMYGYFLFEYREILSNSRRQIEVFTLLDLSFVLSFVIGYFVGDEKVDLARPFGFFAIMFATLISRKHAVFLNMINSLLIFVADINLNIGNLHSAGGNMWDLWNYCACFFISFCSGMMAIFVSYKIKTRLQSVLFAFVFAVPTEIAVMVTEIILGSKNDWILLAYGGMASVFSTLLYIVLLPAFELIFAELTVFRLREITSPNAPLMKRLKDEAPGTYNHSVVVSQLAEACAVAIGEDGEYARAAALYHDVGKLKNPEMFTENQAGRNIHNELTPELSVDIIRAHATDGANLIKKSHLPEFLADAAEQHHGTLPVKYFYVKALKMSDGDIPIANFSYKGPVPKSKIVAILMIADAAEAASRSLSNRSTENIERLVSGIIEERMNLDQFIDCNITMRDLTIISRTIAQSLSGVYHSRVAYPKLKIGSK